MDRPAKNARSLQCPEFRCVQVAKSSHEAADLEKRLKEESDKASFVLDCGMLCSCTCLQAKQLTQENADLQQQFCQETAAVRGEL